MDSFLPNYWVDFLLSDIIKVYFEKYVPGDQKTKQKEESEPK